MSKIINIGVLGCANIAERFILPTLCELTEKFNLIGIASRSIASANQLAEKFDTDAYEGYDSLLKIDNLDVVYIPLPNSLHFEWIKKALEKNIHVLVEKSMACNYEDVVFLNELAKEKKLVLLESFQFRFHSQLTYIQKLVKRGIIGELRSVRSSFGFPPFDDDNNIRYKKELGGGALLDAGAYPLKISQVFLGKDIYVSSSSLKYSNVHNVDIWGSAFLKQKEGSLTAHIAFGFDHFYQNNIELWGSKGKIYTNRIFTAAPNFQPIVTLENSDGIETMRLETDHHFKNILIHFYNSCTKKLNFEYEQNINQARLINELKVLSNEK